MESINQRLVRLRKACGLTMKKVASQIGVPVSTYRDWEYGRAIQGNFYLELAVLFEVSLYELLSGQKPEFHNILTLIEDAESSLTQARAELGPLL